jgi:hypothetical protein
VIGQGYAAGSGSCDSVQPDVPLVGTNPRPASAGFPPLPQWDTLRPGRRTGAPRANQPVESFFGGGKEMVRLTNLFATGIAVAGLALGSGAMLSGCKSNEAASKPAAEKPAAAPAKPAPTKGAAAPAGSKLSKVQQNMSPEQVQEIMGAPSGQAMYPSAKAFTPFNYGNDSGNRVEYKYKGQGRVIFATPRWGGNMKVIRVDYDPTEDGN